MEQYGNPNIVKELHLDSNGRDKVIKGASKLAKAVSSTLGASGRNVLIEDQFGNVQSTKDGVSVASYITLSDPVENMGATLIKAAAKKTASVAGDGTTSATVLADAILEQYLASPEKGNHSFRDLKSGIEKTRDFILKYLDTRSISVDDKMLEQVSIISANNDVSLGTLISDAFKQAGEHGVVTVSNSTTNETHVKSVEGTHVIETCVQSHFLTNRTKEVADLENPHVFLSTHKITNMRELEEVLGHVVKSNRPVLMITPLDTQPLSALAANNLKKNIRVNVISPPSFGLKQKDLMDDLALLTGATVIDESLGDSLDRITSSVLGSADRAISDKDGTTIIADQNREAVNERVKSLQDDLANEDHLAMKPHLERRLALLTGGVSQIYVGADTEVDQKEKRDRVDDATSAVKSAKKEGILPGGGAALKHMSSNLVLGHCAVEGDFNEGEVCGLEILQAAIPEPFNRILQNSGLNPVDKKYSKSCKAWGMGVNTISGEVVDMVDEGIIDPTQVTKEVLKNSISVALTILSSDVIISNVRG